MRAAVQSAASALGGDSGGGDAAGGADAQWQQERQQQRRRRRRRLVALGGELLALHAAELALKQAALVGMTPQDSPSRGESPASGGVPAPPFEFRAGLEPAAEQDRERLLVAAAAIAAEAYVEAGRVVALLDALEVAEAAI